ncbi:hypothetical protein BDW59DRAFT_156847 [Aspergillus cavernicola]|uniref:Zn(2)-C6 fungal-type domain-containing protein n=1 Tax=Aspergillus cavernicola TaxID=176166 RepID=A0ABR4IZZ3_9EURO
MAQRTENYNPLRTTQRAPRSCRSCASRKVKCDKAVPCSTCIKRGEADACTREIVIIRGQVTSFNVSPAFRWKNAPHIPTYEELSVENQRLRQEAEHLRSDHGRIIQHWPSWKSARAEHDEEGLEDRLWDSLSAAWTATGSSVSTWDDVVLPSPACSDQLIAYDKMWNLWAHYAVEYPRFQEECNNFMTAVERGLSLEKADPSWMAVYFSVISAALLMMEDDEAERLMLPEGLDRRKMSRICYDAAIFALSRADFMRVPSIHTVQAIAVLGMCFNNWGDVEVGQHMWSSALRIARRIGLNTPYSHAASSLSAEAQHRLWWTLVICEWLDLAYRPPAVDDVDFDVPLPCAASPDAGEDNRVHYHIFMARTATVVYRFRATIRSGLRSLHDIARVVRNADEELAAIIDTLPTHLQPDIDDVENEELRRLQIAQPWLRWQRYDLTLVLLHLRLRIHRTLQTQWLLSPGEYNWARTVYVSSAMSVIWINRNWDQPASMRKQWAISYHIFVSAILLLHECQSEQAADVEEYYEALQTALSLLEDVKSWNALAFHAAAILRENMNSSGLVTDAL